MDIFMPCQSYLIRHIKNNAELLSYAQMYFNSCEKRGMDREEAIIRYKAMATTILPNDRPNMFQYHDKDMEDEEFVLLLKSDPELPKPLPCHRYCKESLGNGSDLCKTCSYYSGYSNKNIGHEYSLLKFVISSYDNLLLVKGKLSNPRNVFKGNIDMMNGLYEPDPLVVPLPLFLYKAIEATGGDAYEAETLEERLIGLRQRSLSMLVKSSRSGKYDKVLTIPAARVEKIWLIFCQDVLNSNDISPDDAGQIVSDVTVYTEKKKETEQGEELPDVSEMLFSGLFSSDEPANEGETVGMSMSAKPSDGESDTGVEETDFRSDDLPFGKADVVTEGTAKEDSDETPSEDGAEGAADGNEKMADSACDGSPENDKDPSSEKPGNKEAVSSRVTEDNPLYVPYYTTIEYSDPKNINTDMYLSKLVPTEVFRDKANNMYFVFMLRERFYICKTDSPNASYIMENPGMVKICWHPFDILSLCAKGNLTVKNLYSVMENELAYFPGKLSASYGKVCSKYSGILPACGLEMEHSVFMMLYRKIYANQLSAISTATCRQENIYDYFRLLGRSYHRDRMLKEKSSLFTMGTSGQIRFTKDYEFVTKDIGYELDFVLDGFAEGVTAELYVKALCRFNSERFRDIQIVLLSGNHLVLYVPTHLYEYVSSYMQIYFDRYAINHNNQSMSLYMSSRMHDPKKYVKSVDRPRIRKLTSLMDVLDYLASMSVPVKNVPVQLKISLDALEKIPVKAAK